MSNILNDLGVDEADLDWTDLAACSNMPSEFFFDTYEVDQTLAKNVDEMCLVCPVAKMCLLAGVSGDEYGVWGGVYLTLGEIDKTRNSHKTPDIWKRWKSKHGRR